MKKKNQTMALKVMRVNSNEKVKVSGDGKKKVKVSGEESRKVKVTENS